MITTFGWISSVVAYCQGNHRGLPLRDIAEYIGPDFPDVQINLHIPPIQGADLCF